MATLYKRKHMYYITYYNNGRRIRKAISKNKSTAKGYLGIIEYQIEDRRLVKLEKDLGL